MRETIVSDSTGGVAPAFRARVLWWLLAVAPFAALAAAVSRYYLPFPWGESYVMFPSLFDRWYDGSLRLADLYVVQNRYVVLFPALLHIGLGILSRWDQAWEVAANLVLGAGLFAVYVTAVRRVFTLASAVFPHVLVPVVAVLTFSLNQSCNWMWGGQIMTFLSMLAAVSGLVLVAYPRPTAWRVGLAALLGAVATLSFGTGVLVWPVGAVVLVALMLLGASGSRPRHLAYLALWLFAGLIALGVFFASVQRGGEAESLARLGRVWHAVRFLPIFLGAGLTKFHLAWASPIGWLLLLAGAFTLVALWRAPAVPGVALVLPGALMLYSAGLGLSAAFNADPAVAGLDNYAYGSLMEGAVLRYPTMALPYHVALVALLALTFRLEGPARLRPLVRVSAVAGIALLCAGSLLSGRTGYYEAQERYRLYAPEARAWVVNDLDHLPTRLQWPYGNRAEDAVATIKSHRLSLFREEARAFWLRSRGLSNWE
jgi:hypothetical protein